MTTRHTPAAVAVLLTVLAAGACSDSPTPPETGGMYTAVLESPASQVNGAALFELTGAGIDSITATYGRVFTQREGSTVRVAVVGDVGTLSFRVYLADGAGLPAVSIIEVSDAGDELRPSLDGYALRFRR